MTELNWFFITYFYATRQNLALYSISNENSPKAILSSSIFSCVINPWSNEHSYDISKAIAGLSFNIILVISLNLSHDQWAFNPNCYYQIAFYLSLRRFPSFSSNGLFHFGLAYIFTLLYDGCRKLLVILYSVVGGYPTNRFNHYALQYLNLFSYLSYLGINLSMNSNYIIYHY